MPVIAPSDDGTISLEPENVETTGREAPGGIGDCVSIEEYTRRAIVALEKDHSEEQIAGILGISRKSLWEKRKRWNLQKPGKT